MLLRLTGLGALGLALCGAALAVAATAAGGLLPRTELAYVGYHATQADIFVYDAAHGLSHNLTHHPTYDLSPAWSPDGTQIAFVSDRAAGLHIYLMDASGRNVRRLTPPGRAFEFPRWSPDGTRLAFTARGAAGADVFTVNADGSGFQQISGQTADPGSIMLELGIESLAETGPQSPVDNEYLTVDFLGGGGWGLFLSPSEGEPGALLASLGRLFGETAVSWSPDGQRIAFLSSKDGPVDLYIIAPQPGTPAQRVTSDRAYESSPVWRP